MDRASLERRLTLHQLRILQTVVDAGSVTRGAERLSLSQPALTHQLQGLARAVGHPLFQPRRRRLELTPVGQALYERARRILALVHDAAVAIEELGSGHVGTVRVAADTTAGTYVVPDALAAFHRLHPAIGLSLDVLKGLAVREALLRGDADLGVVGRTWDDDVLAIEPLLENEVRCFCAPDHELAGREPLDPRELFEGPLLLRERGSGTRESAEAVLRSAGVEAAPAMEMASNGALKRAVAGGLGVTVLSMAAVRLELAQGSLRILDVRGFPVHRTWSVVYPRERLLSGAAAMLRDFMHTDAWREAMRTPVVS